MENVFSINMEWFPVSWNSSIQVEQFIHETIWLNSKWAGELKPP